MSATITDWARMCKSQPNCLECPMDATYRGRCWELLYKKPTAAEKVVAKWCAEHPVKTYLSDLLEKYPDVPLNDEGTPRAFCPSNLYGDTAPDCNGEYTGCVACWNRPLPEEMNTNGDGD